MRVLLVNDLPPGSGSGAEVYLARLIDALRAAGDEVGVFAGEVRHSGPGKALDLWDPMARRRLAWLAAEFRPDVVHHHNVVRELSVSVLGVPSGVPSVMTVHDLRLVGEPATFGGPWQRLVDGKLKRPLDRAVARRRLAAVIAVSAETEIRLNAARFRGVEQIPGFAPDPVTAPLPVARTQDLLFAGQVSADKGIPVLLAAFAQVRAVRPDARLLVAGQGPLSGEVASAAARLPTGAIVVLGQLGEAEISASLGSVRAVVIPSVPALRPEGTPLIALEAAMHGRPVVVSDDPGLRAVVELLGCGLVVPPQDVDALATAMCRLLDDDAAASAWGAAGAAGAPRHYGTVAVVDRIRALYGRVVRQAAR